MALVALILGVVGAIMAMAAAVTVVWLGLTVGRAVDATLEWTTSATDRLDARLSETIEIANGDGDAGEIGARMTGLADLAGGARESLASVTDHPLYGRLPVSLSPVEDGLDSIESSAASLADELTGAVGSVTGELQARISNELAEVQVGLDAVEARLEGLAATLKRWTRFLAVLGVLLALWALWAQVALARRGRVQFALHSKHTGVVRRMEDSP